MMSRSCSQCGNNGHNSRTCGDSSACEGGPSGGGGGGESSGIMLFGVRVTEGRPATMTSFRKSFSMNNLSQYDQPQDPIMSADVAADGYESDDVVHASGRSRERKRGVPWTEEEHRLFLLGLQKVGKGDWRGISRNFVKSRTPTQVASHAQKYFLRRTNQSRRRRRSSLFDITTDTVTNSPMEEDQAPVHQQEPTKLPLPQAKSYLSNSLVGFSISPFPVSLGPLDSPIVAAATTLGSDHDYSLEKLTLGPSGSQLAPGANANPSTKKLIRPIPILPIPPSSKMAGLNLNHISPKEPMLPLSLNLSTPTSEDQTPAAPAAATTSHSSAFQSMSSGDSIISVA